MIAILPPIKQLQSASIPDLNSNGGVLPTGVYRRITGQYSGVSDNSTEVLCYNFNATLNNTGMSLDDSYVAQATIYLDIIDKDSSAIVIISFNPNLIELMSLTGISFFGLFRAIILSLLIIFLKK